MYLLFRKVSLKFKIRQWICLFLGRPILLLLWGKKNQIFEEQRKKHISTVLNHLGTLLNIVILL